MKAYRWHGPGTGDLQLEDVPIPQPGPRQVLLEVQVCGLCHSDCHIIDGSQAESVTLRPITLGHEVAGTVLSLGQDVTEVKAGDRVAVALGGHPERLPNVLGLTMHGGYAEYAVAAAEMLVVVPDSVSYEHAAAVTDSLTTAFHGIAGAGRVKPGDTVAIVGLGGLGAAGLQMACILGANVYGFDTNIQKFEAAKAAGAKACFARLEDAKDIVFDTIVDFVGLSITMTAALKSIKYRGRIVLVGIGAPELTLPTFGIIWNKVEICGSLGGSKDDMRAVLELIAEGKLKPHMEEIPFEGVNEGLHRLESGQAVGRLYTRPRNRKTENGAAR